MVKSIEDVCLLSFVADGFTFLEVILLFSSLATFEVRSGLFICLFVYYFLRFYLFMRNREGEAETCYLIGKRGALGGNGAKDAVSSSFYSLTLQGVSRRRQGV